VLSAEGGLFVKQTVRTIEDGQWRSRVQLTCRLPKVAASTSVANGYDRKATR